MKGVVLSGDGRLSTMTGRCTNNANFEIMKLLKSVPLHDEAETLDHATLLYKAYLQYSHMFFSCTVARRSHLYLFYTQYNKVNRASPNIVRYR
jgi:hypothetical protein